MLESDFQYEVLVCIGCGRIFNPEWKKVHKKLCIVYLVWKRGPTDLGWLEIMIKTV